MIADRIKNVRKEKKLSQTAFGERLGVARDVISNVELGRVEPKELFIKLLISEFNVNEDWLRTGEGEMYKDEKETLEYMALLGKIAKVQDKNIKRLLEKAMKLKEDDLAKFVRMVDVFIEEDAKKEDS